MAVQFCMKTISRIAVHLLSLINLRPFKDHDAASYKDTGPFLAGKTFSLADVSVFPLIAALIHYGLPQEKYPAITSYYNGLKNRPSITTTGPPVWPDFPNATDTLKDI